MSAPYYDVEFMTQDVTVALAAAGAGKTEWIMRQIVELLKVYRPEEIALVTFTRKGVQNAIERAMQANPHLIADDLYYFQTLHAMAFREAGLRHKNIIERADIRVFNELLGFHLTLASTFDEQTNDDKLMQRYDANRSNADRGVFVDSAYDEEQYNRLVNAYEAFKKENDLVDFYDCLLRYKALNKPMNVKVFIIDEAQDLTTLHWEVVEIASKLAEKVLVAGDDFQSLFKYAGATPETLIHLSAKYPTVKLETSYRLPKAVYRFARAITGMIQEKVDKDYAPADNREGFVKDIPDRSMLMRTVRNDLDKNGWTPGRWYFLFRANHFIAGVADQLDQFSIPYHTTKGFCLEDRNLKKIERYYNYRKEGYGSEKAKQAFAAEYNILDFEEDFTESELIGSERRYVYLDYVKRYGIDALLKMAKSEPHVLLATTYKVKGGECDFCAVFLDSTKLVSNNTMLDLDSELRVLYVASTRPREGLYLVASESFHTLGHVVDIVKQMQEAP